ncbi:uncharacterized protein SPPG_00101 [Spizellomyces punctatus DAOM BR117]|uniref:Spermatogenesis-associated protein 4 n=1 Tax=Spizellomyces punctatus (strain DAOM BR117) TaxID=645134 RepID=A0A0L0HTE1_SPIPD|nr:uncharacterized protein SPPG_00101 [Spizellomyces punctatus DAOM BR117]KND04372.1 hypothetical protein SPPG_00101 [Spizellomyces punctatus DAOM BR117]|eukprot:XP_016612411.1 hypothetical protein SPPG_00101 [Spizellomyces punctatus DAOM BR117]
MSGLPREVLKWLQSLDLAYPIKNPKRDFSNGYLIAEIFCRYYPNDLLLNVQQFYTGDSNAQKVKNWEQLEKFFKKHDIGIPKEAMHAVMTCQVDAATLFVENVYMMLTKRRIHRPSHEGLPAPEVELVPHFALPTTSNIIRCIGESPEKAQAIVEAHKEYTKHVRAHRAQEPTRPKRRPLAEPKDDKQDPITQISIPDTLRSGSTGIDQLPIQHIQVHQNMT